MEYCENDTVYQPELQSPQLNFQSVTGSVYASESIGLRFESRTP
jgi:hypothetical protein